jgi:hypothetical protein
MGPEIKRPRVTRRYTTDQLAALTGQPVKERSQSAAADATSGKPHDDDTARVPVVPTAAERGPARARSATLEDPMTTAMLAEVARQTQTIDFDDELIEDVVNNLSNGETPHPHVRRRTR